MLRTSMIAAFAALAVLLVPGSAQAANVGATFTVTATVGKACSVSALPIVIAGYDPNSGTPTVGTTNVNVACTKGTTYTTFLTSANSWKLLDAATPANVLTYAITQAGTGTPWADAAGWGGLATTKAPIPYLATATIGVGQDVPAGSYTDTVTVNVNY
jgi:spore coat protein U-like protein